ncbi:hypothetical protein [Variovorax sp. YR752]|uniref:hypothetical protein n=1 Tax=Variovorax sp. YR752 TaxID=1884383 RepID=UPI003137FB69
MRVFVGPLEVAGIGAGFVEGLRANGASADLVCAYAHRFAYSAQAVPARIVRWWAHWGTRRAALPASRPVAKGFAFGLQQLIGWAVLAWAVRRYDAFVFLYGETITNTGLELNLLRWLGKRTVVVFVGSDARPPYIDGGWFPADRPFDLDAVRLAAARQQRKVTRLERQASLCVNALATAHFHRRRFVDWFALGIPRAAQAAAPAPNGTTLRALHSPSHPVLKGTARIRAVVEALRAKGVAIELVTIEGRPNAEVMQALRDCDLAIDQLYSDTPMAAFATEAASVGRAVLIGGYNAGRVAADASGLPMPPTRFVHPDSLETALEALAADRAERERLGAQAHAFVAGHWSPAAVGARLLCLLRDDIPPVWWREPAQVTHLHGCGLAEDAARDRVRSLIDRFGAGALQLDDKPALREAFIAFAKGAAA